ncbi:MAG: D-glycero-beta-D-manno-heptose-7-phosphate kinase [Desulfovibrionaceae bacterium]|nr:D-glycero-beta-D-manno-heptose-7-phosphate kinase [Desulfovibrionaceae bacterium]
MNRNYSPQELIGFTKKLVGKKVLVFGDIMLDRYLHGDANRISPEAPVPVVHIESKRKLLGGAGNVARNIKSMGGEVTLISMCGKDHAGDILAEMCEELSIDAALLRTSKRKTITKNRIIARHQQILRYDEEDVTPLDPDIHTQVIQTLLGKIPAFDVLVISDYGKGLVSNYFFDALRREIKKQNSGIKLVIDPKTPNYPLYDQAFLLTPNAKETSEASDLPVRTKEEIKTAGIYLKNKLHLNNLLTTLGPQGMVLFDSEGEIWHIPTVAKNVFDVTGAGDTVIAAAALCLAADVPLLPACIIANYAAGIVVGEVGAACVKIEELTKALEQHTTTLISTW